MSGEKAKNLFLVTGIPGSGKSTYIKNHIKNSKVPCAYISRDEIRFSIIKNNEEYFSHETEVFNKFISEIQNKIDTFNGNIFVDATHLNEKSRNKVFNKLNLNNTDIYIINFDIPVEECIRRNEMRSGRTYVPPESIWQMARQYKPATDNEKYKYKGILDVKENIE